MTREEVMLYEVASSPFTAWFGLPVFRWVWVQKMIGWYFAQKVNAKWQQYQAYLRRQQ
jgi:hypothetical protein